MTIPSPSPVVKEKTRNPRHSVGKTGDREREGREWRIPCSKIQPLHTWLDSRSRKIQLSFPSSSQLKHISRTLRNTSTWETEVGESLGVQGQPGLRSEF